MAPQVVGVATICLPVKMSQTIEKVMEEEPDLNQLNIAGWGHTEDDFERNSDVLKQANIPFVAKDQCTAAFEDLMSRTKSFSIDISDGILVRRRKQIISR